MADESTLLGTWSRRKKLGFGAGLVLILAALLLLAWWAQRTPQAVLFSDLSDRDAAVLAAELDKLKQPYSFSEDGHAILVGADHVHRTRMTLMGKPLPLHGAVGFELFNNADFGVSDFVQKVNYQRALQGELTRTLLAIDQVQDARVHLALPEQGLFRKDGPKAKASVSVSLKGGQSLQAGQVSGIQRLLAASVPEIKAEDVTVLDQHGVVLSRTASDDTTLATSQLDARQGLELHLTRKAARLLDEMFGAGEAMVAVDVVLDHEQTRVTTEEALGTPQAERASHPAGVITRERSTTRETSPDATNAAPAGQWVTQETDYQTGKRVAHTLSPGGQIAHLNVAVVVRQPLDDGELARVRQLVATAVGLQAARGDLVTVQSMAGLASTRPASAPDDAAASAPQPARSLVDAHQPNARNSSPATTAQALACLLAVLALGAAALLGWRRAHPPSAPAALSDAERDALLAELQQWLEPHA